MVKAFISYSHSDETIKDKIVVHLAALKRDGKIEAWQDQEILVGDNLDKMISIALTSANLFLAILSPDYLNSNYCYEKEFQEAIKLQALGKIIIIPIIAEHCDWLNSPFRDLKAVPKDGKPISAWTNDNAAYLNIISEIRRLIESLNVTAYRTPVNDLDLGTSKNYKVKKDFTQVDIINYRREAFQYLKSYFIKSIEEINTVDNIQSLLLSEQTDSFSCIISNRARVNSSGYITVYIPKSNVFGRAGISYTLSEQYQSNSIEIDKNFTIENDQYQLYWSASTIYSHSQNKSWSIQEIAEKLWLEFVEQVGISFNG